MGAWTGARVWVRAAGLPDQLLEVQLGSGFLGSDDPRLHAGLGRAESADLSVRWPDGSAATFLGVRANSVVHIAAGEGLTYAKQLPLARITAPGSAHRLGTVAFSVQGVAGTDAQGAQWTFEDDGSTALGLAAQHAFADVGFQRARAEVQDALGQRKVATAPVRVWDDLAAEVVPDQATFLPTEQAQGTVLVRFSNGDPVRGAHVNVTVQYGSGVPELDAAVQLLPRAARTALGYLTFDIEGDTDASGAMRFVVPWNQPSPSDLLPYDGLNMPGVYAVRAQGGARGSVFPDAAQTYAVGARLA
ncbi:MAG: ASPIC/UnbV domain-containing protein [Halobacteriales archaeon]|nr:ASPIC/UnbV domain-containing protein [Halobacteriales archaeon]